MYVNVNLEYIVCTYIFLNRILKGKSQFRYIFPNITKKNHTFSNTSISVNTYSGPNRPIDDQFQ